eukprot:2778026-Rhodomonas_salina.2
MHHGGRRREGCEGTNVPREFMADRTSTQAHWTNPQQSRYEGASTKDIPSALPSNVAAPAMTRATFLRFMSNIPALCWESVPGELHL